MARGASVKRLGFVGAGRMGLPMVRRLVAAGHEVRVLGRTPERRTALTAVGALAAHDVEDAACDADAVVVCAFTDRQVREICLDSGLLDVLPRGAALIVHTTVSPRTVHEIAEGGAARDISVLDAPVSGGPHDIAAGRLTVFAGGDDATVDRLRPVLAAYADPVLAVGPVGAGQAVKLLNNALFTAQLGLVAEAARLGRELGVDEAALLQALGHGSSASRALAGAASRGSSGRFISDVREFVDKDVAALRRIADGLGVRLGALEPALAALDQAGGWLPARLTGRSTSARSFAAHHHRARRRQGEANMGRVEGKVAFITGAARGQGRSHAVRLAEEGADIVAIDLCRDYETVNYPMATPEDLKETARLIEKLGRKCLPIQADVRSIDAMRDAVARAVAEFGGIDIVVAQAGIAPLHGNPPLQAWSDAVDVDLIGSINAIQAALPHLREGASVIATASTAALMEHGIVDNPGANPGGAGYAYAKRALAEYMHELARNLAPLKQRANVVHPTNCNTQMLQSEPMYKSFRPDLEHPTRQDAEPGFAVQQAMPIPYVEPVDISNAVLFLASDEARYITGVQLRVDAGGYLKWYDWKR